MLLSDVSHPPVPFAHNVSLNDRGQAAKDRKRKINARSVAISEVTAVTAAFLEFAEETLMLSAARCPPQPSQTDSPDEPVDVLILRGPVVRPRYTLLCNRVRDLAASMVGGEGGLHETDSCIIIAINSQSLISQVSRKQRLTGADRPFKVVGVSGIDHRGCSPFDVALDAKTLVDQGTLLVCTVDTEGSAAVTVLDALRTLGLKVEVETISAKTLHETWVHAVRQELAKSATWPSTIARFARPKVEASKRYATQPTRVSVAGTHAKQSATVTDKNDGNCTVDDGLAKSRVVHVRPARILAFFEEGSNSLALDLEDAEFVTDEEQRVSYARAYRSSFAVSRLLAERRLR